MGECNRCLSVQYWLYIGPDKKIDYSLDYSIDCRIGCSKNFSIVYNLDFSEAFGQIQIWYES